MYIQCSFRSKTTTYAQIQGAFNNKHLLISDGGGLPVTWTLKLAFHGGHSLLHVGHLRRETSS